MTVVKSRLLLLLAPFLILLLTQCKQSRYGQGERLYLAHCANCHMEDGKGLAKLIPPLAGADYLKLNQDRVPCIIRHGQSGEITVNGVVFNLEMPGEKYTDIQIYNMGKYFNTTWGNDIQEVTITETQERLKSCQK